MIPLNKNEMSKSGNPGPARTMQYNLEYTLELVFEKFSKILRIVGPIFAFALTTFVLIVAHAFFQIILPFWINQSGLLIGLILAFMACFFLFSVLFNYFLAVLIRPGSLEDIKKSKFYR